MSHRSDSVSFNGKQFSAQNPRGYLIPSIYLSGVTVQNIRSRAVYSDYEPSAVCFLCMAHKLLAHIDRWAALKRERNLGSEVYRA
jgi:hypothetical protein